MNGKIISSLSEFKDELRKQLYPLGYTHNIIMDWQYVREGKGHNVQIYNEEFTKKALDLNISLDSQETLLKHIGG